MEGWALPSDFSSKKLGMMRAKQVALSAIADGLTIREAMQLAERSEQTYENWRREDKDFVRQVDELRSRRRIEGSISKLEPGTYGEGFDHFSEKYLGSKLFDHQRNILDVIEGRDPRWLHPSMKYERNLPNYVLVNVPPEHCAEVSTPILTGRGWTTVGDVNPGDQVVGRDGQWWPVMDVWEPAEEVDLFELEFSGGTRIRTDAGHKWHLEDYRGRTAQTTTGLLFENPRPNKSQLWRIAATPAHDGPDADLPLDPYLLGYWLGDGDSRGYRIACGEQDLPNLQAQLSDLGFRFKAAPQRGGWLVYVYGMTPGLRAAGVLNDKHIPDGYFLASEKQRLALLQGLMDSDGTITAKDGRARWVQHHRPVLARDVYRLAASLGHRPSLKQYGVAQEVGFTPHGAPVFRLERKAGRQKPLTPKSKTHHTLRSVTAVGRGRVRCITVDSPDQVFALGDAMIRTHNAKSMTFSINYPLYRICQDPNVKVMIVSKTKDLAKEFLYAIKQRMTHPRWFELQTTFSNGGFKAEDSTWQSDTVYLGGNLRDSTEKDPTVQAIGMGGQIYGTRADVIILDDCVLLGNAQDYEKQIRWIQQDVLTRLGPGGLLLILGTRVDTKDLYSEIVDPDRYPDSRNPWTVLRMPAVLEFDDDKENWTTLWPKSDQPWSGFDNELEDEDGLFPRWDGGHLYTRRGVLNPKTWAMVYQQQEIPDNGVFNADLVRSCVNAGRKTGRLVANNPGHPDHVEGMYILCSLDPAMGGDAGAIAYAVDRKTHKRYVLDARRVEHPNAVDLDDLIKEWTVTYTPNEWRIEKNAFQKYLTQNETLRNFLTNRGVILHEHYTGRNVWDQDFGISAMSPLFGYWIDEPIKGKARRSAGQMIEFPSTHGSEGVKSLIEQLITWEPKTKNKKDMVMALWFAEIRAKEITSVQRQQQSSFGKNSFLTDDRARRRMVIDMSDFQDQFA